MGLGVGRIQGWGLGYGLDRAIASKSTVAGTLKLAVINGEFTVINRMNGIDRIF